MLLMTNCPHKYVPLENVKMFVVFSQLSFHTEQASTSTSHTSLVARSQYLVRSSLC
uniref:Uncharacterized protein n=1 Tax=Arion vulgaris TaxID=1028688 RepID=A0A0B6ZQ87_9EUPU